jgi:hypothetical protein
MREANEPAADLPERLFETFEAVQARSIEIK